MKEFRSNNFYLQLFSDNETLYLGLKEEVNKFYNRENFLILKDTLRIYSRENFTTDYVGLRLVEDNIPSLLFEICPYRLIVSSFLKKSPDPDVLISDLSCILLIESILEENKSNVLNKKVLRQLATDIFSFWKESLFTFSVKEEKVPENLKSEYDLVIRMFLKKKSKRKIELEYLYEACIGGKSNFLNKEEAQKVFGEKIVFYGVSEIDPLHFRVLEILSEYVPIQFLIPAPRLPLIHRNPEKLKNAKLKELLPEWSVLQRFVGDKKISDVETIFDFSFLGIPKDREFLFLESQEAYREIEFIGREILSLVEEKKNTNFRLTSIKLILPSGDLNYSLLVSNTFTKLGIPFAFTKDKRKKKSPYFSAVVSLLKLSLSDFDKDSLFSLFYNPCFYPVLEDVRIKVKPEIWNKIVSRMNLTGFLDKQHKKNLGFRESNLMTWESLWMRLNSILIGDSLDDSIALESELLEEVYEFLEISSSLLQDLIGLKEDFSSLTEFSKFFRILIDTYLSPNMRYNKTDEIERLNERGKTKVNQLLFKIESIEEELKFLFKDNLKYSLEDFVDILTEDLDSWTEGDSRVLKNGVVVGELMDVIDPSFDYVFLVGLDERKFSIGSNKHDSVISEESIFSSRLDSSLKLRSYFYHIFNHNAKKYTFSYVSLDTIKDREYYPAYELEQIREAVKGEFQKIPLFSYLEYKQLQNPNKVFDKHTYQLIQLKKKEDSLLNLKNSYPIWEEESNFALTKEVDVLTSDSKLSQRIKSYFLRPSFAKGHSNITDNMDLSASKFVSYLECPKKFFFHYSIQSQEEEDISGELDSLGHLQWNQFIKEVFHLLLEGESINTKKIVNAIFNSKRLEFGEIPFGILGKLAELEFESYLETYLIPFYSETIFNKFKVVENVFFDEDKNKRVGLVRFSTPSIWGQKFKVHVDYLLLKEDTLYLTLLTTSKSIKDKKNLLAGFITFLLEESVNIQKELATYFGLKKINLAPAIFHFPQKNKLTLKLGSKIDFDGSSFLPFWESLKLGKFPASPIPSEVNSCSYCPVNTICHGYQNDFFPFLEPEMKNLIDISKKLF